MCLIKAPSMEAQPYTGKSIFLKLGTRAAENGSIECAKIILEYNADIDALNFQGQTSFHVVIQNY